MNTDVWLSFIAFVVASIITVWYCFWVYQSKKIQLPALIVVLAFNYILGSTANALIAGPEVKPEIVKETPIDRPGRGFVVSSATDTELPPE